MFTLQSSTAEHWLAAAVPGRLVVVEVPQPSSDSLHALWDVVHRASGAQDVLSWLTRTGLLSTPAFVLVETTPGGGARFIVRGTARLTVTTDSADRTLDASGVSTWLEQVVADARAFEVTFSQGKDATTPGTGAHMLVNSGAAWVSHVSGDLAEMAPVDAAPAEERTAQQEPTPAPEVTIAAPLETVAGTPAESGSEDQVSDVESGDEQAFGATVVRSIDDVPVNRRESESTGPDESEAGLSELGDHDGLTVFSGDISGWRERVSGAAAGAPETASPATQLLPVAERFVLSMAGGAREPLVGPVLVGRAPSVSQVSGGSVPRLLTVGGADQDISRNHVQFSVEGGTVVVTDLHSRNGTLIVLPGKAPQKLRAGEPTSVIPGTVVDLGGGVTMTVEHE